MSQGTPGEPVLERRTAAGGSDRPGSSGRTRSGEPGQDCTEVSRSGEPGQDCTEVSRSGEPGQDCTEVSRSGEPGLEWCTEVSRSGEPTLRIGDRWVHSRYAPRREATDLARAACRGLGPEGGLVVLLGLGLGYVPEAFGETAADVVAFDPFPEITGAVLAESPVRVAADLAELEALVGRELERGRRARLLVHPGYQELCRFEARAIAGRLRALVGGRRALRVRDAVVSARSIAALERLPYRRNQAELADCCAGRTALCVSPGPSLDAVAIAALRERTGGVLFAALQALRPLQRAGVRVDFVVAPDPHEFRPFVDGVAPTFGALLADSSVHPELLDRWPAKTVLFHLETPHLHQVAWQRAGLPILDEPVTTVSETMLALAERLGAARFVLVGMDFCGEPRRYRQLSFRARDAAGRPVVTNGHYLAGARYLSHRCPELAAAGRPVLRVGAGLPVAGATPVGPEALAVRDEPPLGPHAPGPDRNPALWRAARDVVMRAARGRGAGAAPGPRGEGRAARRREDFQPLAAAERRVRLAAARARLEADPADGRG